MIFIGLLISIFLNTSNAGELTLHFIPSPIGVNWRSPQALTVSTLKNQVAKYNGGERHEIGHVYVELGCGESTLYTGMTSVGNSEERGDIFKRGYGLGILFKTFAGMLDDPTNTQNDIESMQATGRSSFVRFQISDSTCGRLTQYIAEFKANHYDEIYAGLNARPLNREGSGCSAFAASFLELSGLQIPEFENQWVSDFIIPWKFIGGPLTGRRVSILKMLFAFRARWATSEDDGVRAHFWDPEVMHAWTQKLNEDLNAGTPREFPWPAKAVISNQSLGVEFDTSSVPTPIGPIFKN